ncbi:ubiquinone biosynthesis hydrox [Aulographum hederae CBS 113979]|uniref:Ubiquinone biosynthesis monooxygenase COQ6, mitochondrial n=1 Tax=Aulographum hederae CBS 113979 TaxID=1176131 RepID=A0A6G1HGS4_9PEZI|nr:ubiquinone biosynthesis hydrox [Aulographum hederae CBS 113979]
MQPRVLLGTWRSSLRVVGRRRTYATAAKAALPELYDVVCVGGGPAGLSILTGLRASPITSRLKVALIEGQDLARQPPPSSSLTDFSNRCSSLTPASVKYLEEIGAWHHIKTERVQPYQEMQVWDGVTDSRIEFDWAKASSSIIPQQQRTHTSGDIAYMTENTNITTALMARLKELGGVDTYSPVRVSSIELGQDTPTLDLSSWPVLSLSDGRSLAARLLIGADGANSPVRTFANIASHGWDYNRFGVVATLQLEGPGWGGSEHKIAYQRFLPTGPIALLPLPGNMASLVWSTTPDRAARLKSLAPNDFVAMVNAAFRLLTTDITYLHSMPSGHVDEVSWREQHTTVSEDKIPMRVANVQEGSIAAFPLKMRHADTYIGERIALVGDAAHTIHPLAGQGLNQGQADAAALVRTIETAVEGGMDIGNTLALEAYNSEQYAKNNALLGVVDKLHKLYSFETGPVVPLRSLGLKAVDGMGWVKDFLMRRAAGV